MTRNRTIVMYCCAAMALASVGVTASEDELDDYLVMAQVQAKRTRIVGSRYLATAIRCWCESHLICDPARRALMEWVALQYWQMGEWV